MKNAHVGVIPGLKEFVAEFLSDRATGDEGYLADKGLIPLPAGERTQVIAGRHGAAADDQLKAKAAPCRFSATARQSPNRLPGRNFRQYTCHLSQNCHIKVV